MAKKKTFEIGSWQGKPNYISRLCSFSSLDFEKFKNYMSATHGVDVTLGEETAVSKPVNEKKIETAVTRSKDGK